MFGLFNLFTDTRKIYQETKPLLKLESREIYYLMGSRKCLMSSVSGKGYHM